MATAEYICNKMLLRLAFLYLGCSVACPIDRCQDRIQRNCRKSCQLHCSLFANIDCKHHTISPVFQFCTHHGVACSYVSQFAYLRSHLWKFVTYQCSFLALPVLRSFTFHSELPLLPKAFFICVIYISTFIFSK